MNIKISKINNKYFFIIKKKQITTNNGNLLEVKNKIHANLLINDFHEKKKLKDPYSLINLTFFSCNLNTSEKNKIKNKILELLDFDVILYRSFEDIELIKLMNNKTNSLIDKFSEIFQSKITLRSSILDRSSINNINFKHFLDKIDNFQLTVIYKLAILTKSVILTYFFFKKKINDNTLYKLSNIEYTYQQKRWGVVEEQKVIDINNIETLKKISFFFKIIN